MPKTTMQGTIGLINLPHHLMNKQQKVSPAAPSAPKKERYRGKSKKDV